jgi:hypothetical protein
MFRNATGNPADPEFAGTDIARLGANASLPKRPDRCRFCQNRESDVPDRVTAKMIVAAALLIGSLAALSSQAAAAQRSDTVVANPGAETTSSPASLLEQPGFLAEPASHDVLQMAHWVLETADNRGLPFVIVDKKDAKVFVLDGRGKLLGATSALLGLARGDDSAPGIGDRKLADIRPEERTTPAGRFVAGLGIGLHKQEILWLDYHLALALHRVLAHNSSEQRLERIAAASPRDKRITFGCVNVPANFYDRVVHPAFTGTNGIVYILPEVRSIADVFFALNRPNAAASDRLAANSPVPASQPGSSAQER